MENEVSDVPPITMNPLAQHRQVIELLVAIRDELRALNANLSGDRPKTATGARARK